ncbi:MAG: YHS domain-containing protein [Vicinamibacteria bacterium]|nr:YHS domain-containing protein [Vicinamibacteria bacterium]
MATAGEKTEKTVAEAPTAFEQSRDIGTRALCPVTRRELTIKEKTARSEHKGRHYVFCCPGCKPKFDKDPANYLSQERQGGR